MNDAADVASVTAPALADRRGRWLRVILAILAAVAAAGGAAAGGLALAGGGAPGWRLTVAAGSFGAGAVAAAVLWTLRGILLRQQRILRRQQRILDLMSAKMFPNILEVSDEIPMAEVLDDGEPAGGAAGQGDRSSARVPQILERVLAELAQIQADMLLTPEQLEARREERRRQEVRAAEDAVQQALEAGQIDRAERMVDSYRRAFPDSPRAESFRAQLADLLADQAEQALRSGDLVRAEQAMDALAEKCGDADRADKLRDRVVGRLADEIERALLQDDLAGAAGMLAEFEKRFPDDSRAGRLRARLVAARQAVQGDEVRSHRNRIEEWMALAQFDRAETEAHELAGRHPDSPEAERLLDMVRREASAFRAERRSRLYAEIKRFADAKQWRHALDAARRLVAAHPECPEAQEASAMMSTLEENAKIEQVREMRDGLTDMVRRRRFAEALEIARDVIDQFPDSQAAIELRSQLPRLVELSITGQGHPL